MEGRSQAAATKGEVWRPRKIALALTEMAISLRTSLFDLLELQRILWLRSYQMQAMKVWKQSLTRTASPSFLGSRIETNWLNCSLREAHLLTCPLNLEAKEN